MFLCVCCELKGISVIVFVTVVLLSVRANVKIHLFMHTVRDG